MSTLDIRSEKVENIDKIAFGDDFYVEHGGYTFINIRDDDGDLINIKVDDIDNLIKALRKAKELWGEDQ